MSGIELDVTAILTVWMSGSVLLVMVTGAALRYGVAPVLGAVADMRARAAGEIADPEGERRLAEIEERLNRLESASGSAYRSVTDSAA